MFNKIFKNKSTQIQVGYGLLFFALVVCLAFFLKNVRVSDFLNSMESRTFDLRQSILASSKYKKPSKDIVLVTIDDASYEYLLSKYGEWPIPRDVYAQFINYVEKQNPKAVAFDLMFIKSIKSSNGADSALVKAITENKNVYTAMNLDNQASDVRTPIKLPKNLTVSVENNSSIDFSKDLTFTNCRGILPQLINGTQNIGMINVSRADDGILRKVPAFELYQGDYYPELAFLVGLKTVDASKALKNRTFFINRNKELKINNRSIPVDKDGGVILNWYGPAGKTFTEIPLYKILKAANGDKNAEKFDLKNKIVYVGVTATSLEDKKSVPIDKLYPGVEVHATYINNLMDNNFIKRTSPFVDVLVGLALAIFVGIVVFKTASTFIAIATTILTALGYTILTYYLMKFFNIWLAIVLPLSFIVIVLVASYIVKYLLKSRDFEHQYRLATTDGLTELYNHRYFQEQMIMQIENSKRYDTAFSLIIIDIDFFKKFNDIYGHQSGDAVLRQVAQKLKKNVRSADYVCRYGGEEMTIILPNTDKNEAIITAEKICQTIAEAPFKLANDKEGAVTISLGVATYPQDGKTPAALIEHADQKLYIAKENGRNQVSY